MRPALCSPSILLKGFPKESVEIVTSKHLIDEISWSFNHLKNQRRHLVTEACRDGGAETRRWARLLTTSTETPTIAAIPRQLISSSDSVACCSRSPLRLQFANRAKHVRLGGELETRRATALWPKISADRFVD